MTYTFKDIMTTVWGQIAYSILGGVFGVLLIVLFLTGLMSVGDVVGYIPWIVGFNGAVTGYTLLDRTKDRLRHKRMAGAGAGLVAALVAGLALNAVARHMVGMDLISFADFLLMMLIGGGTGGLGAMLAVKYFNLKDK